MDRAMPHGGPDPAGANAAWAGALEGSGPGDEDGHIYLCIDLKTFYASVECVERGLDPFTHNLVVADTARGASTICLAVTPALKRLGVRNRCRIFEIPEHIDYLAVRPRMRRYMEVSARIYGIYLDYVSAQDIHVYSIDECFIDAAPYLSLYDLTARQFADELRDAVLSRTGITASVGIGPNLFLAKVALDITAKRERDGIGILDGERFRRDIWPHRPITDIWGIGAGTARRLATYHVFDLMGVAALDERILYREFGTRAEYLIDHAHGVEPCTIAEIKSYRPQSTSMVNGQVLCRNYSFDEALTVLREMVDASVLDLVGQGAVASSISLWVGYGSEARDLMDRVPDRDASLTGEHGRRWGGGRGGCAHAGRQRELGMRTNSRQELMAYFEGLYIDCVDRRRPIKRLSIGLGGLLPEEFATIDLFTDTEARTRERGLQKAIIDITAKTRSSWAGACDRKRRDASATSRWEGIMHEDADRGSSGGRHLDRAAAHDGAAAGAAHGSAEEAVDDALTDETAYGGAPAVNGARAAGAHGGAQAQMTHGPQKSSARRQAGRAAQFMPFAALTGYYELVRRQERVVEERRELTEEEAQDLSRTLLHLRKGDPVRVTFYESDAYRTLSGVVEDIDTVFRTLRIEGLSVSCSDIISIKRQHTHTHRT